MSPWTWFGVGAAVAVLGAIRATFSPCGQSMLASLTPYAEAGRGNRWRVTASAFSVGAVCAGALGGLFWGSLGSLAPGGSWRLVTALVVLAVALSIDATPLRTRLPLTKRQVNEDWMSTFRGWVYGVGFGAQLGLGFITLVACAAIYATFAVAFLSGSPLIGVCIGAVFGATKAASLLPAGMARTREALVALHQGLIRVEPFSVRAVPVAELAALAVITTALV
ncbi:MAG: hypothetical protein J2O48_12050 [Solirubrobacterales bacterium]|nr:hypothetical protein [Solirubrobacterales bacterium]